MHWLSGSAPQWLSRVSCRGGGGRWRDGGGWLCIQRWGATPAARCPAAWPTQARPAPATPPPSFASTRRRRQSAAAAQCPPPCRGRRGGGGKFVAQRSAAAVPGRRRHACRASAPAAPRPLRAMPRHSLQRVAPRLANQLLVLAALHGPAVGLRASQRRGMGVREGQAARGGLGRGGAASRGKALERPGSACPAHARPCGTHLLGLVPGVEQAQLLGRQRRVLQRRWSTRRDALSGRTAAACRQQQGRRRAAGGATAPPLQPGQAAASGAPGPRRS